MANKHKMKFLEGHLENLVLELNKEDKGKEEEEGEKSRRWKGGEEEGKKVKQ